MRARLVGAAVTGFVIGATLIGLFGRGPSTEGEDRSGADASTTSATNPPSNPRVSVATTTVTTTRNVGAGAGAQSDGAGVLLVWTSGGLPAGFDAAMTGIDSIEDVSTVSGEQLDLMKVVDADGAVVEEHRDGWAVPLDVLAVDPDDHSLLVAALAPALAQLGRGQALLTEGSADLRRVGVGATLELRHGSVEIVGIVDDVAGAGAELLVHADDRERLGPMKPRYMLVRYNGDRHAVQRAIDGVLDELDASEPIRFRTPAETTWLRHGDAVLPALVVKSRFGEFAYRDRGGGSVQISPSWIEAHVVTVELPVVGSVTCHEEMITALESALGALVDAGLEFLVDPGQVAGCFVPRRIEGSRVLSRHTWGIAIDLNVGANPRGSFSTQDSRLVEIMRGRGFGWGGSWLVPDPAHYELVALP